MTDSVRRYRLSYMNGVIEEDGSPREPLDSMPMVMASAYDQLAERLAASEAEVARQKAGWAEAFRLGILHQRAHYTAAAARDFLRDKLAKLAEYAQHKTGCDKLKQMPAESNRVYSLPVDWEKWVTRQPCTCGLAAFQSSNNQPEVIP